MYGVGALRAVFTAEKPPTLVIAPDFAASYAPPETILLCRIITASVAAAALRQYVTRRARLR